MTFIEMLLIVCPLVFFAAFIDSIAGGGGLISLPAFMLTKIPIHTACGSNKFSACMGSAFASIRYYKNRKMHVKSALISAALSLLGAAAGSKLNLVINSDILKKIFIFILPLVAIFVLFGGKGRVRESMLIGRRLYISCAAIGFFIGMYDGLIGPGTGTFLIFCYTYFVGFDYVTASGNAKVANLASNLSSMFIYILSGNVFFKLAVPAAIFSIAGGYIGSGLAIKKGTKLIKSILVLVLIGIFIKLILDIKLF